MGLRSRLGAFSPGRRAQTLDPLRDAFGIKVWTYDPDLTVGDSQTGSTHARGNGVWIAKGTQIATLSVLVVTAGAGMTHGQGGIYQWDGSQMNLLASSADLPAAFQAAGFVVLPLSATWVCPADGIYYLTILMSGTTMPFTAQMLGTGAGSPAIGQIPSRNLWRSFYAIVATTLPAVVAAVDLHPTGDYPCVIGY